MTPPPDRLQQFLTGPRKALWIMALPMIAGMTVHTVHIVADTAFIGRLGTDALAAVTFVAPLFFVIVAVTNALGTAVTALVAQAVGRQEQGGGDAAVGAAIAKWD
jgi:Na+-driven multidrug efflux pump